MSASKLRDGAVAAAIRRHRVIVVLRRVERDALLALVDELADAGVRAFEITLDADSGPDALATVRRRLAERVDGSSLVGAGTVLRREQLHAAREAGADFVVSPLFAADLVRAAVGMGMPTIPGAMTPTEATSAWASGATFVKLFPASAVGPSFIRELRGPLPDIELIPTGGVDASNANAFLAAGAVAVGIGGALVRASADERRAILDAIGVSPR